MTRLTPNSNPTVKLSRDEIIARHIIESMAIEGISIPEDKVPGVKHRIVQVLHDDAGTQSKVDEFHQILESEGSEPFPHLSGLEPAKRSDG